jgi:hypothetical protein
LRVQGRFRSSRLTGWWTSKEWSDRKIGGPRRRRGTSARWPKNWNEKRIVALGGVVYVVFNVSACHRGDLSYGSCDRIP